MMATEFRTDSLVEAALLFMRTSVVRCVWVDHKCQFVFDATEEDIAFACNAHATVKAREFNFALRSVKTAMYASKDG